MENSKIIEQNKKSVILLRTFIPGEQNKAKVSIRGTGFVVSEEGHFITCAHVYKEIPASELQHLEAQIPGKIDGNTIHYESMGVEFLRADEENDVALMKLKPNSPMNFTPIKAIGDAETIQVGDEVIFLGYPLATELLAMGFGITMSAAHCIVSAVKRRGIDKTLHFLMIDTHLNFGSSGSPVFSRAAGEVIGIASGRISNRIQVDPTNQSKVADIPANMGICRPINYVQKLLKS